MPAKTFDLVRYRPALNLTPSTHTKSMTVLGLDTEADRSGKCFMICTSLGDIIEPKHFPACMFNRRYIGKKFVTYNLKYDSGALIQHLPLKHLKELQELGETEFKGYFYKVIGNKCLTIRYGKNTITIYDIAKFYKMKLETAATKYLNKHKIDLNPELFDTVYIASHFSEIATYCIQDAVLAQELAQLVINSFEKIGVYPRKLYSAAYLSWQYFKDNSPWINVKKFWNGRKEILNYAMQSYNGGKFEVTRKGCGYYYEYDIVSAYPKEIADLVDIRQARLHETKTYIPEAVYGFIKCNIEIPYHVHSPIALKRRHTNIYPVGSYTKVITKNEYDYLKKQGCNITIIRAYWLVVDKKEYPYRKAINELFKLKAYYKKIGDKAMESRTKDVLNSFYGKMIQLIWKGDYYEAGSPWNPIYGSIITANVRLRISAMQQRYKSIIAVHTDSIISTEPLPFVESTKLGDMSYECEGQGVILGSGIYQVGKKSKIRGFDTKKPLIELLPEKGNIIPTTHMRPYSWREIAHLNLDPALINRFTVFDHDLNLNFDSKRIWLDDYQDFSELKNRCVESSPWEYEANYLSK